MSRLPLWRQRSGLREPRVAIEASTTHVLAGLSLVLQRLRSVSTSGPSPDGYGVTPPVLEYGAFSEVRYQDSQGAFHTKVVDIEGPLRFAQDWLPEVTPQETP